jgi:hypothetical protein
MAQRSPQTQAKRARELALKERREFKRAKKAAAAEQRSEQAPASDDESVATDVPPTEA